MPDNCGENRRPARAARKGGEEPRDLAFSDFPMFDAVMVRRHDLCRQLAEALTGREIGEVLDVSVEESIEPAIGARGVRLDALVRATGALLDVEMQTYASRDLGRRMRYYQAAMDVSSLRRGSARSDGARPSMPYASLPESFIVFICLEDQLGRGLPVYSFDVTCEEDAAVRLGHGWRWVVLNASAWPGLPAGRLRAVLRYVATGEDDGADPLVAAIAAECAELNGDAVWKKECRAMMTLQHDLEAREYYYRREGRAEGIAQGRAEGLAEGRSEGLAEGRAEGIAEGEGRTARLFAALLAAGRADDAARAASDAAYRARLFDELGV